MLVRSKGQAIVAEWARHVHATSGIAGQYNTITINSLEVVCVIYFPAEKKGFQPTNRLGQDN
jgi:hypothetical protein